MDIPIRVTQNVSMADRTPRFGYRGKVPPPHFVWHWREYRKLSDPKYTQEWVAEQAEMTANNLSQLENYKQGFSPEGLAALAYALKTSPGALQMINPLEEGAEGILQIWMRASPEQRARLAVIAEQVVPPEKPGR